jgi:hypothetical protein
MRRALVIGVSAVSVLALSATGDYDLPLNWPKRESCLAHG